LGDAVRKEVTSSGAVEQWVHPMLDGLSAKGLERTLVEYSQAGARVEFGNETFLNFSCNDYLNLARDSRVVERARNYLERYGASSSASRLVTGTLSAHVELEALLGSLLEKECSLVFSSGYLANMGAVSTLVGRGDCIFLDRLVHATCVDGAVLSRAKLYRFAHNDVFHLEELLRKATSLDPHRRKRFLIVTESVFSMDGDIAPLEQVVSLAEQFGAMVMVDEAHAIGVLGPGGKGVCAERGLSSRVNLITGTLSKGLGSYGGFVACSEAVRKLLINRSRLFIYNTALPPASLGGALGAIEILKQDPTMGVRLLKEAAYMRDNLRGAGLQVGKSESHIIPVIVGDNELALGISSEIRKEGLLAIAIRPPTVPEGTARIRFSLTLGHSREDIDFACEGIIRAAKRVGVL